MIVYIDYNKIESFRLKNKLTKKQFSSMCNISTYIYNKILVGILNFKIDYLLNIAKTMSVSLEDLLFEEHDSYPSHKQNLHHILVIN